jgi:phage terminase large subunit-like protein
VLGGECIIDNNPINKFCLDNVVIISDINGNTKPSKNASSEKIDGVIAMVQALGGYLLN